MLAPRQREALHGRCESRRRGKLENRSSIELRFRRDVRGDEEPPPPRVEWNGSDQSCERIGDADLASDLGGRGIPDVERLEH